jgi:hypothetical protein
MANNQLTDGGPSATPELPSGVAGPPFDAAVGSTFPRSKRGECNARW